MPLNVSWPIAAFLWRNSDPTPGASSRFSWDTGAAHSHRGRYMLRSKETLVLLSRLKESPLTRSSRLEEDPDNASVKTIPWCPTLRALSLINYLIIENVLSVAVFIIVALATILVLFPFYTQEKHSLMAEVGLETGRGAYGPFQCY